MVARVVRLLVAILVAVKIFFLPDGLFFETFFFGLFSIFCFFADFFFFPIDFLLEEVHFIVKIETIELFKVLSVLIDIFTNSILVHWILFIW